MLRAARRVRGALLAVLIIWPGLAMVQAQSESPAPPPPTAVTPAAVAAPAATASPNDPSGRLATVPAGALVDAVPMADAQLARALADLRAQQRDVVDLKLRLASAESAARWLPWLFLVLVGVAGVAVWLGLRVRRLQQDKSRRDWAAAEAELHATLMPDAPGSNPSPLMPGDAPLLSSATGTGMASQAATPEGPMTRAEPAAPAGRERLPEPSRAERTLSPLPDAAPRAVTVEEMLDLEQQVDFFMVLGQEDAAIDLLLGHVRSTGGINAMPYLKLLEIYRQQGDQEAFERTRERFNQRFNASAPPFADDLAAGRHLEDYPQLVARLQRAWPQPLRALAELEGLLLRRADLDPLDLPAFHDVLTLHALVRDLPAGQMAASGPGAAAPAPAMPAAPPPAARSPALPASAPMSASISPSMSPAMAAALAAARAGQPHERTQTLISARALQADASDSVDLLLPLDAEPLDTTQPRPRLAEPGQTRAMVADWMQARSTVRAAEIGPDSRLPAEPVSLSMRLDLDLDLTELAPPPREFTRPGAFTDLGLRRDARPSDRAPFDDSDLLPPSFPRR